MLLRTPITFLLFLGVAILSASQAAGTIHTVTTTEDTNDVFVGDGVCATSSGDCTLRAAIQESNYDDLPDEIQFNIPPTDPNFDGVKYTIPLSQALPGINSNVAVTGPGAEKLVIRADTGGPYRIFEVNGREVSLSGLTVSGGEAVFSAGGGIRNGNTGTLNVFDCVITDNEAATGGGGIAIDDAGTLNVSGCTLSGNTASVGGAIANSTQGTLSIIDSTLSDNTSYDGGAVFSLGSATIENCTLSGNSALYGGAIIFNGDLAINNSTIAANTATSGLGGGIYSSSAPGIVRLSSCTISNNVALGANAAGGGIYNLTAEPIALRSCIVALNSTGAAAPDVSGNFASSSSSTSEGFNLIGKIDGSSGFTATTDQTGTVANPLNPQLDPTGLQENGGPTRTIKVLFGSRAIDKGSSNGLTGSLATDQRGNGFMRAFDDPAVTNADGGDGTDIGAFEVQTSAPSPTPTPTPTSTPSSTPTPTPIPSPSLTPSPTPSPSPTPATLGNISTRLRLETGDNVLIGGFIITGTESKEVLVRAIGPSLPLSGKLANPVLELRDSSGVLLAGNDNWMDAPNKQAIIDSTIPPENDLESAILMTLEPAAYTTIMRGVDDGTGIGLIEAYDLDQSVDSQLANISTRGLVQTGDDVMIGGFILVGEDPKRVLVRAIGPSLGLVGNLEDPTLELYNPDGSLLASNDNWRDTQEGDIIDTTVPPENDFESAIVAILPSNGYTAIVRGKDGSTGIALVEVYALSSDL